MEKDLIDETITFVFVSSGQRLKIADPGSEYNQKHSWQKNIDHFKEEQHFHISPRQNYTRHYDKFNIITIDFNHSPALLIGLLQNLDLLKVLCRA